MPPNNLHQDHYKPYQRQQSGSTLHTYESSNILKDYFKCFRTDKTNHIHKTISEINFVSDSRCKNKFHSSYLDDKQCQSSKCCWRKFHFCPRRFKTDYKCIKHFKRWLLHYDKLFYWHHIFNLNETKMTTLTTFSILLIFLQAYIINMSYQTIDSHTHNVLSLLKLNPQVLLDLGGLNSNKIRQGEFFRIVWSMWLHSSLIHVLLNILPLLFFLRLIEPHWGWFKTLSVYLLSGFTGNLLSAVNNPCSTTVGASGCLFGIFSGMIPYSIEYWSTIKRPKMTMFFYIILLCISVLNGWGGDTDNWSHLGGFFGGFLFSLLTMKSFTTMETRYQSDDESSVNSNDWMKPHVDHDILYIEKPSYHYDDSAYPPDLKTQDIYHDQDISRQLCESITMKPFWDIIFRIFIFIILMILWIGLCYRLLYGFEFQPVGQMTFSNKRQCCCCYTSIRTANSVSRYWTCHYCDLVDVLTNITFEARCQTS